MLRKKYGGDEVLAWNELRRTTRSNGIQLRVVSATQFDETRIQPRRYRTPPPGPNWTPVVVREGERDCNH
jgi:hypothetical protein